MVNVSAEIVAIIYYLMPGFITAWIFYGLTAHRRLSPFERTVQALIFTAVVRALVLPARDLAIAIGTWTEVSFGEWTENVEFVWAVAVAILLGHLVALAANTNAYHRLLYRWGITRRTSFPSEWYSTFTLWERYILLHLSGQRRLMGWPYEWPDHPDSGHFVLQDPTWIMDDNTEVPILTDEFVMVPVTSVEMVEILKYKFQTIEQQEQIEKGEKILVDLQNREVKISNGDDDKTDEEQ